MLIIADIVERDVALQVCAWQASVQCRGIQIMHFKLCTQLAAQPFPRNCPGDMAVIQQMRIQLLQLPK